MSKPFVAALRRSATIGTIIFALSGCVASTEPLFDPASGDTVLREGRYIRQQYVVGHWLNQERGSFKRVGSTYSWTQSQDSENSESGDAQKFTLHNIGKEQFIAMTKHQGEGFDYVYDLVELSEDGLLRYGVDCKNVKFLRTEFNKPLDIKADGFSCITSNIDDLKNVLRTHAGRSYPAHRYVPTGPL